MNADRIDELRELADSSSRRHWKSQIDGALYDSEIGELLDIAEALRTALDDIGHGRVPPDEKPSFDDAAAFRHAMWTWSQKRAKAALAKLAVKTGKP